MICTRVLFCRRLAAGLAATLLLAAGSSAVRADVVTNPISAFPVTIDGFFTDGVVGGVVQGEWSDVTPLAFNSPAADNGTLFQVPLGSPLANSLLYAALAPSPLVNTLVDSVVIGGGEPTDLYLLYDYLPRTNPNFAPGEFIADVSFPIRNVPDFPPSQQFSATVHFRGGLIQPASISPTDGATLPNFHVFVTIDQFGNQQFSPAQFGMEGAVGFGPSALGATPHLQVELEVGLFLPAGFLNSESPPQGGVYSPEPAFWGSGISNDAVDPPASAALFQILPGGTVVANSNGLPFIPEPASAGLALTALVATMHATRRRGSAT